MTTTQNFDLIEQKIREYKTCSHDILRAKSRLEEVNAELKALRKTSLSVFDKNIPLLNEERSKLKVEISNKKRQSLKSYKEAEELILSGLCQTYSEIYERQLSRLYGYKIEITYKNLGDDFDERTCIAKDVVITKNKAQHLKVLNTLSFGIVNLDSNTVEKKAVVEICAYSKKHPIGSVMPFDIEYLKKI